MISVNGFIYVEVLETTTLTPTATGEVNKEEEEEDLCAGHCENTNHKCELKSGQPVCKCLEGYLDANEDGISCKCVREWFI